MAKSRVKINADSDTKRGYKTKGLKLLVDTIAMLEALSVKLNQPQNQIVTEAISQLFKEHVCKEDGLKTDAPKQLG